MKDRIDRLFPGTRGGQRGFTLIEILVVLLLIGILASVSIPAFHDVMAESVNKSALQAVAEGRSRLTNQYAIALMKEGQPPDNLTSLVSAVSTDAGDYRLAFSVSDKTKEVTITATGVQDKGVSGQSSGTWQQPQ